MHVANIICTLALAASSLAITVNTPSGWTTTGPNVLTWTSVATDHTTFAAVLVNNNKTLVPSQITIEANETTSSGTFTVTPDSPYPAGSGFQVNFLSGLNSDSSIYGQSGSFNITPGTKTSSSSSTDSATGTSTSAVSTSTGKSTGSRVQIASGAMGVVLAVLAVAA
ncbi:hypothetical protein RQP46_009334 [Phenoliferia psychrophenolica]